MFAWDSTNQRRFMVPLEAISDMAATGGLKQGVFPDNGHVYYEFTAYDLETIGELV